MNKVIIPEGHDDSLKDSLTVKDFLIYGFRILGTMGILFAKGIAASVRNWVAIQTFSDKCRGRSKEEM